MLFSAAHWAPTPRLFPPWPPHRARGGRCVSHWRVCPWSSLFCLTKLLSRYNPQTLILTTCSAAACPNMAPGNTCCFANVLRAAGKRMMLWKNWIFSWICCSHTEWVHSLFKKIYILGFSQGSPAFHGRRLYKSRVHNNRKYVCSKEATFSCYIDTWAQLGHILRTLYSGCDRKGSG